LVSEKQIQTVHFLSHLSLVRTDWSKGTFDVLGVGGRLLRKHAKVIIFLAWDKTGQSEARHVCVYTDLTLVLASVLWLGEDQREDKTGQSEARHVCVH